MSDEEQKINGHAIPPQEQVMDVGAIVQIDAEVIKHGVLFVHPQLPPFKLWFSVLDGMLQHRFEVVGPNPNPPKPPEQPKESGLLVPGKKKIILPPGHA